MPLHLINRHQGHFFSIWIFIFILVSCSSGCFFLGGGKTFLAWFSLFFQNFRTSSNSPVVQPGEGGPTWEAIRKRPEPTGGVAGGGRSRWRWPWPRGTPGDPEKSDGEEASVDEKSQLPRVSLAPSRGGHLRSVRDRQEEVQEAELGEAATQRRPEELRRRE